MPYANGFWAVEVARAGTYRFTLRHQPAEAALALRAKTARLAIGDVERSKPVPAGATAVAFDVELKPGQTRLQTWLDEEGGKSRGAFFVDAEYRR